MITLKLPYPISANRYWATRVVKAKGAKHHMPITYVTSEAQEYKADVQETAIMAGIREPIKGRIKVEVWLYPNRPQDFATRQRKLGATWDDNVQCIDLDNANKVLLDALKGLAFEDDKWVRQLLSQRMEPDDKGARVVVRITPISTEQQQGALL